MSIRSSASSLLPGQRNFFGPRLRELREKRRLSAMDVCRRLQMGGWDVSPPRYTQIEKQRRSLSDIELRMILRTLKASWSDLE